MFILEGKFVFFDGVWYNWFFCKLSWVVGFGSGVMMELCDVLRLIFFWWINGYIEIFVIVIVGWYYIVGFKFK